MGWTGSPHFNLMLMKSIVTYCLLFIGSTSFGQNDTLGYHGGTYSFGKDIEKGAVGYLAVYPVSATKALFYLDVCRGAPSYNMGMLFGVMDIEGSTGTYENHQNEWMDCSLQFVFAKKSVVIDYFDEKYNCGFGHAVYANNTYKLVDKEVPQYYISGEGDTIPFIAVYANMVETDFYRIPEVEPMHEFSMESEGMLADNQLWLGNDTLGQVLVSFEEGDYGEFVDAHFYKTNVPKDLIHRLNITTEEGEMATNEQKERAFKGFVNQATPMVSSVFESRNHIRLGDSNDRSLRLYGEPAKTEVIEGVEVLFWDFDGEHDFYPEELEKGERIARDSFGFRVIQYYRDGKLIAQFLASEMP